MVGVSVYKLLPHWHTYIYLCRGIQVPQRRELVRRHFLSVLEASVAGDVHDAPQLLQPAWNLPSERVLMEHNALHLLQPCEGVGQTAADLEGVSGVSGVSGGHTAHGTQHMMRGGILGSELQAVWEEGAGSPTMHTVFLCCCAAVFT